MTATTSSAETPAHKQTPPTSEIRGTRSPQGPRRPIGRENRSCRDRNPLSLSLPLEAHKKRPKHRGTTGSGDNKGEGNCALQIGRES